MGLEDLRTRKTSSVDRHDEQRQRDGALRGITDVDGQPGAIEWMGHGTPDRGAGEDPILEIATGAGDQLPGRKLWTVNVSFCFCRYWGWC